MKTKDTDNTSSAAVSDAKPAPKESQPDEIASQKVFASTAPSQEDSEAKEKRTGWWNKVLG